MVENADYDDMFCDDVDADLLPWVVAIERADTSDALRELNGGKLAWSEQTPKPPGGDLRQLAELLCSDTELTRQARDLLADLLERHHQFKRHPGGQRIPAYTRSVAETNIIGATAEFRCIASNPEMGAKQKEQAFQRIADDFELEPETVHAALLGKLGSDRRRRRR